MIIQEWLNMSSTEIIKAFGVRLKELRKQKGWTQKELAGKVGVRHTQLNKYECGLHTPPVEVLIKMAEAFNTSVDFLLTGNNLESTPLHNLRLIERMQKLQDFQEKDIEAILNVMDAMILKHKVQGELKALN
jgi:transcriptional regulator with XRE-family HTH domain